MKKLIAILAITTLLVTGLVLYPRLDQKPATVATTQATEPAPEPIRVTMLDEDILLKMVNEQRQLAQVKTLETYQPLVETSQERADDMFNRNYFSHYDPISKELLVGKQDAGCRISENIALTSTTDRNKSAIELTLGSKAHREAMLNPEYDVVGIGISGNYAVFHFCDIE